MIIREHTFVKINRMVYQKKNFTKYKYSLKYFIMLNLWNVKSNILKFKNISSK